MEISTSGKLFLVGLALFGVLAYVAVLDLGLNAGRIHYGVTIDENDVGGLTLVEAANLLERRAEFLARQPVTFRIDGFVRSLTPQDVGWRPDAVTNARRAMRVGRSGGVLHAIDQRARAWLGRIDIRWRTKANAAKVGRLIARWERDAAAAGLRINRPRLRFLIRRAIVTWPRRVFEIPLGSG